MRLSFFALFGIITVTLAAFFMTTDYFQISIFNEVFAKSEEKNKNFEDEIITQSSDTSTKQKTKSNNSQGKIFDDATISQSSDTSTTIGNKNKDKASFIKRPFAGENPKIHSAITHILEHANPKAIAKKYGASLENDQLFVYVHLAENQKKPSDIEILAKDKDILKTKLNLNQIKSLANLDSIEKITLPEYAVFYDHITSEGVAFSMADTMHSEGFNGTGIKVGVIDDSFIISNSEISNNIGNTWNGTGCADIACGKTDGDSHGTAVAGIVVDMAPGVSLWLYAIEDSVDFANAVEHAITNDVDILTASLGFPNLWGDVWYRDGTSRVAEWVDWANGNGTLFTVAAGNQGDIHYSDLYVPVNNTELSGEFAFDVEFIHLLESVMTFNSSATGNMKACLPVINNFDFYTIRWNGTLPTDQDYDVMLYDSGMENYTNTGRFTPQNGSPNDIPMENFTSNWTMDGGNGCLVVGSFNSTENHIFHIEVGGNTLNIPDDDINRLGSIDTPADAVGSLSVGAVNFNTTPTNYSDDFLEVFSSQGPTDDGRLKPEICGPDGTMTSQTTLAGGTAFFGTSASTPHVAGAAALILDFQPSLTVDQLRQKLIDDARFDADFSQDNLCGISDPQEPRSGLLSLFNSTTCQNVPTSGTWTVNDSCILKTNSSMDNLIVQNNSFLIINPGITLDLDSSNSLIIQGGSSLLVKSGASITYTGSFTCGPPVSGNWIISSDCTMTSSDVAPGNVTVQNNAVLTIPSGITLNIDFANFDLIIKSGGSVLVKSGGELT